MIGPLLWNEVCDAVINLPMPADTKTISFGDDVAVVIVAMHLEKDAKTAN